MDRTCDQQVQQRPHDDVSALSGWGARPQQGFGSRVIGVADSASTTDPTFPASSETERSAEQVAKALCRQPGPPTCASQPLALRSHVSCRRSSLLMRSPRLKLGTSARGRCQVEHVKVFPLPPITHQVASHRHHRHQLGPGEGAMAHTIAAEAVRFREGHEKCSSSSNSSIRVVSTRCMSKTFPCSGSEVRASHASSSSSS